VVCFEDRFAQQLKHAPPDQVGGVRRAVNEEKTQCVQPFGGEGATDQIPQVIIHEQGEVLEEHLHLGDVTQAHCLGQCAIEQCLGEVGQVAQ